MSQSDASITDRFIAEYSRDGRLLKTLRTMVGMTQSQVSAKAGVTQQTVAKLEAGQQLNSPAYTRVIRALEQTNEVGLQSALDFLMGSSEKVSKEQAIPVFRLVQVGSETFLSNLPADFISPPASVQSDEEAYGLIVLGMEMHPSFASEDILIVSSRPGISPGDDVVFRKTSERLPPPERRGVRIASLVDIEADKVRCQQWNPHEVFELHSDEWPLQERVVGWFPRGTNLHGVLRK